MAYERYLRNLGEDGSVKVHLRLLGFLEVRMKDRDFERVTLASFSLFCSELTNGLYRGRHPRNERTEVFALTTATALTRLSTCLPVCSKTVHTASEVSIGYSIAAALSYIREILNHLSAEHFKF